MEVKESPTNKRTFLLNNSHQKSVKEKAQFTAEWLNQFYNQIGKEMLLLHRLCRWIFNAHFGCYFKLIESFRQLKCIMICEHWIAAWTNNVPFLCGLLLSWPRATRSNYVADYRWREKTFKYVTNENKFVRFNNYCIIGEIFLR